jgi:hypothetical protein
MSNKSSPLKKYHKRQFKSMPNLSYAQTCYEEADDNEMRTENKTENLT